MRFIHRKYFFSLAIIGLLSISFIHYQNVRFNKKNIFNFLLLKTQKNNIAAAYLITHYPKKNYFHVYLISDQWSVVKQKKSRYLYKKGSRVLKEELERLLATKIDYVLKINDKNSLRLLRYLGNGRFFNTTVEQFPKGEFIINDKNYHTYIQSLPQIESIQKKEIIYSIWLNILYQNTLKLKDFRQINKLIDHYYSCFKGNLSKRRFKYFLDNFIKKIDVLYISKSQMNVEFFEQDGKKIVTPLQNGAYDRKKYQTLVENFQTEKPSSEQFPIKIQIYNTTPISRLASKISGVLRLKKCNTLEYLNANMKLKRSIILDRSGSSIKKNYFSKITRVSNIYYSFDYRENFDFSLYIGEDYYAIPYILKR